MTVAPRMMLLPKKGTKSHRWFLVFLVPTLAIGSFFLQRSLLSRFPANRNGETMGFAPPMERPAPAFSDSHVSTADEQDRFLRPVLHSNSKQLIQTPVFVLSLPKSGTTTMQKYFNCGKPDSAAHHWSEVNGLNKLQEENSKTLKLTGECFAHNVAADRPILQGCGDYQVWTDSGAVFGPKFKESCFFPSSSESLANIAKYYPNATIVLSLRKRTEWLSSLLKWGDGSLLRKWQALCAGFPPKGGREKEWFEFYQNHTETVRQFAARHPAMTYVEVQLEDPQAGFVLENRTGISPECWKKCRPDTGCQPLLKSGRDASVSESAGKTPTRTQHPAKTLPPPVFVLSLPKSGSTLLQKYLNCGEFETSSHHWSKLGGDALRKCLSDNVEQDRPMLTGCGNYTVWTELGGVSEKTNSCFYPSVHGLDNIAKHYPTATILLMVRQEASDWYSGLVPLIKGMIGQWRKYCDGFPSDKVTNRQAWEEFYEDHTAAIRRFAAKNPNMTYIELDLDSADLPMQLEHYFGIPAHCSHHVRTANSGKTLSLTELDSGRNDLSDANKGVASGSITSPQSVANISVGHNMLPTPVFVLSLPKSGTTSAQKYFNCARRKSASHHWSTLQDGTLVKNGACLGRNVELGRPMLEGCGDFDAWTDAGSIYSDVVNGTETKKCFFPSVHGLEQIATHYPNASILLTVRDAHEWYRSVKGWNKGALFKQLTKFCGGFPEPQQRNDEAAWVRFYESHTESIRRFSASHPSLTYVEVSLGAAETPHILEEKVGISAHCWGDCKPHIRAERRCRFSLLNETWGGS